MENVKDNDSSKAVVDVENDDLTALPRDVKEIDRTDSVSENQNDHPSESASRLNTADLKSSPSDAENNASSSSVTDATNDPPSVSGDIKNNGVQAMDENYSFDGNTYTYTDKTTNILYHWDAEKNVWVDRSQQNFTKAVKEVPKNIRKRKNSDEEEEEQDTDEEVEKIEPKKQDMSKGVYGYEGDTYTYTDSADGTKYFWDQEKSAWFPKIDNDFIAYYQMSYGFTQPENKSEDKPPVPKSKVPKENEPKTSVETAPNLKRKTPAEPPTWFEVDDEHNTKVYVSNLPLDFTETEFVDLMQKFGLITKDVNTGKMKVKLYTDPGSKNFKGDALCTYIKKESVVLALDLMKGMEIRGHKILAEKAKFNMKGDAYDPSLKPKKLRRKDREKIKKMQEKLFAWQPDKLRGERPQNERVVVLKNLFDPKIFDQNLGLIVEYRQDLREECAKCGDLKKVVIYDKHPDGIAQIWFKDADSADACIQLLNNRWFSQRRITAETWDGKTRYKVQETPEEEEARLKKWEEYLNSNKDDDTQGDDKKEDDGVDATAENIDNASDGTRSSADSDDETDDERKVESV